VTLGFFGIEGSALMPVGQWVTLRTYAQNLLHSGRMMGICLSGRDYVCSCTSQNVHARYESPPEVGMLSPQI